MPKTLFPGASPELRARLERDPTVHLANSFDWSQTEIGPITEWPEALRAAVRLMMATEVPMVMLAGAQSGTLIYNRGYAEFAGDRHPAIFGKPVETAWPEIAAFNRENMRRGFAGESWYLADQELVLDRHGLAESAWMNLNYSPVLDESGTPLAIMVVVIETTQRVLANRALAESRQKLDLALSASGLVGTWDWDVVNDRVTADERFASLFSVPVEAASAGVPIDQFVNAIHPHDQKRVSGEIAQALERGGETRMEYRLVRPDGSTAWVVASGTVIHDDEGRAVRFPGVVVDISDQKAIANALAESEARFRTLADTMPQMVWSTQPDGYHDYYNARWYEFTGIPQGTTDGSGWNNMFHPDDQGRAWQVWKHSLATGEPYRIEYRLRHRSGEYRWVLGQALPIRDEYGRIMRWFGTCTDIHEGKLIAEERDMVAQELSHRIKNIFSVITGIVSLSARTRPEAKEFADQLRARIFALGRAHDFVRPHSKASAGTSVAASLRSLITELLSPYQQQGGRERVIFEGEDAPIDEGAATPLALLFHEMATNAAKYGALSTEQGVIRVTCRIDGEDCHLTWKEEGGPPTLAAPTGQGFGSKLITLSVEGQLRGSMERIWDDDGLRVELRLPLASLSRSARLQTRQSPASDQTA
ncbi:PAS domain S-box-containing protein [Devosia enhydra]|uniref:Blue-light-activated histidine kinase n=1 Tax=Devosia enhydra TaxID=665118 RepID=A0A1K2HVJ6_9HYPH|nr:PAS domain-containing protein [Devosia enhydra]SFZ81825.1 PAS domain S-box-containing protein [Devosia enhydra]